VQAELVEINGGLGTVFRGPVRVVATVTLGFDAEGRITAIHSVAGPDRLQAVGDGIMHDRGTR
jgi:RNA polymerase sigma-70 factor (ECF subfamily)